VEQVQVATKKKAAGKKNTKGQLISEYLFDVVNFPKNNNNEKVRQISAQKSKIGQIIR
jgi:hypothetical protein